MNWKPGDDVIIPRAVSNEDARRNILRLEDAQAVSAGREAAEVALDRGSAGFGIDVAVNARDPCYSVAFSFGCGNRGSACGPVIVPVFKTGGRRLSASTVGSTPTRFRQFLTA